MRNLTERQKEVLEFISSFTEKNSFPPTVREIGEHFDITLRAVQDHLAALHKKGYISICQKRSRSIRILKSEGKNVVPSFMIKIPIINTNIQGNSFLDSSNIKSSILCSFPFVTTEKEYFAINSPNNSMLMAGILEGDIVIAEHKIGMNIADRNLVLALIDGNICVRRIFKEQTRIRLQAENTDFPPTYCQKEEIIGLVVSVMRSCNNSTTNNLDLGLV